MFFIRFLVNFMPEETIQQFLVMNLKDLDPEPYFFRIQIQVVTFAWIRPDLDPKQYTGGAFWIKYLQNIPCTLYLFNVPWPAPQVLVIKKNVEKNIRFKDEFIHIFLHGPEAVSCRNGVYEVPV